MVNGRKFSWRAVSLATILCVGLGIFGLADKASEVPRFSVKGLVACLLSLVGSAVCANLQDMLLKRDRMAAAPHPAPIAPPSSVTASVPPVASSPPISSVKEDLMLYQNFVATALAILYCAITGDLAKGTQFLMYGPRRAVLATFGSVSFVYVGMFPLLQIVQQFDATQAQVVTSLRKAVTFVASFVIYPKPFTGMHMMGLLADAEMEDDAAAHDGVAVLARGSLPAREGAHARQAQAAAADVVVVVVVVVSSIRQRRPSYDKGLSQEHVRLHHSLKKKKHILHQRFHDTTMTTGAHAGLTSATE